MYKKIKLSPTEVCETGIFRIDDGMFIPFNNENTDYINYLKWLDEGNTPLPADEPLQG